MAITVADNFKYGGQKPNFERDQFNTKAEMLAYSPNFLDEGHISYCVEDKKHYKWNGAEWEELITAKKGYGENLFINADFSDGLNGWSTKGLSSSSVGVNENTLIGKAVALDGGAISQKIALNEGSEYTITSSCYVGGSAHNGLKVYIGNQDNVKLNGETVTLDEGYVKLHRAATPKNNIITFAAASSEDIDVEFITAEWTFTNTEKVYVGGLSMFEVNPLDNKQDKLESGVNIKTINGESVLGEGNIEIASGGSGGAAEYISDFVNGGVINISTTGDIETIYNSLAVGGTAICIIGDSNGLYPSTETRVNVNSKYCVKTDYLFSDEAIGANVGDMLMISKQNYLLINRCALKIIPLNDAKTATSEFNATSGILSASEKTLLSKAFPFPTHNVWDNNMNEALESGVYPWCLTGRPEGSAEGTHFTCITIKSVSADNSGYYTYFQLCIGREGADLGKMFQRIFFLNGTNDNWGEGWKRIDNPDSLITSVSTRFSAENGLLDLRTSYGLYKESYGVAINPCQCVVPCSSDEYLTQTTTVVTGDMEFPLFGNLILGTGLTTNEDRNTISIDIEALKKELGLA